MRILLADDELELTRAISAILEFHGYEVDVAYNGIEAITRIEEGGYDTIILDIMMPGLDGITVLKQIRALGIQIPVLLLTAKGRLEDRIEGFRSGADDYLIKPFATNELLARLAVLTRHYQQVKQLKELQAQVARGQMGSETMAGGDGDTGLALGAVPACLNPDRTEDYIACCGLRLDVKTCTASCRDKEIRLTNKEYQLLEIFLNSPRQVFSADYLLERVWGYDTDSENNVVWTAVSRLRKIIYELGSGVKIKTSRGLGYYLEGNVDE